MAADLSDTALVVAGEGQFSCPLGDAIVLLDMRAGLYFSLDNVGAAIWQLLQQPRTVKDICDALLEQFDVTPDTCRRDLVGLLRELEARGLVDVRNAVPA
jgi:hypothetical protein